MQEKNERSLMIAGESGMGIESMGEILMQLLARHGYWLTAEREYMSLIKYGQANVNIHIASKPVFGMTRHFDIGVGLGRTGLTHLVEHLAPGGFLLYNFEKTEHIPEILAKAKKKNLQLIGIATRTWLEAKHRSLIMENTIMIGALAKVLQLPRELLQDAMLQKFGKKASLIEKNLACLEFGYESVSDSNTYKSLTTEVRTGHEPASNRTGHEPVPTERILIDGNTAIALGAIHAGVRCFFAYPMSPSSSILTYMAATAHETGVLVKQVEDEITAAQMTLGASYAGARAMTATSGGGFDLMTETVSLAGMIEVPLVICIAQRPGPATGLPTWTAQGDLTLAIYGGHGEFARIVIAVSDPQSCFELTQHAHDLAERFQVPVILLTDKHIAENFQTVPVFEQGTIPLQRNLVALQTLQKSRSLEDKSGDALHRYQITDSGVSPRWFPSDGNYTFFCNGDEHNQDGVLDESLDAEQMILKRIRKLTVIEQVLPDPVIFGNIDAGVTLIGRGSTKNVMMDLLQSQDYDGSWRYIHVEYMWPTRKEFWERILGHRECSEAERSDPKPSTPISRGPPPLSGRKGLFATLETNAIGQFANLLQQEFGVILDQRFCKANGRPFYREEVSERIKKLILNT